MIIQTVIIEDEMKSAGVISELVKRYAPWCELAGIAGNVSKSVELIESQTPHIVFLDVEIADGTGFDVLRRISARNFELIFITAYNNYAIEAFRYSAIDYLLKPVGIPEFEEAMNRARQRIIEKSQSFKIASLLNYINGQADKSTRISIATLNGFEFVDMSEIVWCNSEGAYTTFHFSNRQKLVSSRNLGFYEMILAAQNFCRIHHGVMINIQYIKSYMKGKGGYVIMKDGTQLAISQRRKGDFLHKYTL